METPILNGIINTYYESLFNNEFADIEAANNVILNYPEKLSKHAMEVVGSVRRVAEYIAGSNFFPEKYGFAGIEEEYKGLIIDLEKNTAYHIILETIPSLPGYTEEALKDSKVVACHAFALFLENAFWETVAGSEKGLFKLRKKYMR